MKKNNLLAITILITSLLMIATGAIILNNKDEKPTPSRKKNSYGTNLNKDLFAKAMIYAADERNYTTENYMIDVKLEDNNYVVEVKSKDGELVENISIDLTTLQKWNPNNASPETYEIIGETNDFISVPPTP